MIIRACILLHNKAIQSNQDFNDDDFMNEENLDSDNEGDEGIGIETRDRLTSQLTL